MNPSGSQGTQCVHQDFLRVVDTDTYQQNASMCIYRATQDGSRGLTFVINHGIRVLVAMTQLENHMSQPCLTVSEYKIFELIKLIKKGSLPMGVIELSDRSFIYFASIRMNKYHRVRAERSRWE
jgi:hypothetical protein